MAAIMNGEWIADLGAMVCRNINNGITVEFQIKGNKVYGKIKDMPIELLIQWSKLKHGEQLIQKTIKEAEEVFMRGYIESEIERETIL